MEIDVVLNEEEAKVLRDALLLYESACVRTCSCSRLGEEYDLVILLTKKLGFKL